MPSCWPSKGALLQGCNERNQQLAVKTHPGSLGGEALLSAACLFCHTFTCTSLVSAQTRTPSPSSILGHEKGAF
eukprot:1160828-Pelagomonas_calceolata.AAC.2